VIFVLFNSFGDDFTPDSFVETHSIVGVSLFKKGTPMSFGGKVHSQSGLSISFEESLSSDEAICKIEKFVNSNRVWLSALAEQPVESAFNIGITVGSSEAFVSGIDFGVDFLELISSVKLRLNICCYPTSDESDEQD
jgi:hypothetical protein